MKDLLLNSKIMIESQKKRNNKNETWLNTQMFNLLATFTESSVNLNAL